MKKVTVSLSKEKAVPVAHSTPAKPPKSFTPASLSKPDSPPSVPTFESFAKKAFETSPKKQLGQTSKAAIKTSIDTNRAKLATGFQLPTPIKPLSEPTVTPAVSLSSFSFAPSTPVVNPQVSFPREQSPKQTAPQYQVKNIK
jgi:hypothetical protein